MARFDITGERVGAGQPFAEQIVEFSGRYERLLGALATAGTEVKRERVTETDPDIQPCRFIRGAEHIFIFPPQSNLKLVDSEGVQVGIIPGTAPYTLRRESQTTEPETNTELVTGKLRVYYNDSEDVPELRLVDIIESEDLGLSSDLPAEVQEAIEVAFQPVASSART